MKQLSRAARVSRDLCLGIIGVLTFLSAPASIASSLMGYATYVWSSLLIISCAACLLGGIRKLPLLEVVGCTLAGIAFATWATAAVTTAHVTGTSWVVFWLLIYAVAGQVDRASEVIQEARPIDWNTG